jgi:hypothetical protein
MKSKAKSPIKKIRPVREQILYSALASFRMEGIQISKQEAKKILKKIEISLGK